MNKEETIKRAIELIADNFGESTARLYEDFYKDKDEKDIKSSVKELLTELVGPQNAQKQVRSLYA